MSDARSTRGERRARRTAGYTLIEVMMGVALSAIGVLGVAFMQTTSVRSNQDAFEGMIATNFARTWLERVRRDALLWNAPGDPVPAVMFAGRGNVANGYFVPGRGWVAPLPLYGQESSGANYHGTEIGAIDPLQPPGGPRVPVVVADTYYCAHLRFTTVQNDAFNAAVALAVDARVYWARKGSLEETRYDNMLPARTSGCESAAAVFNDAEMQARLNCNDSYCLRTHYLRTVIRWVAP